MIRYVLKKKKKKREKRKKDKKGSRVVYADLF